MSNYEVKSTFGYLNTVISVHLVAKWFRHNKVRISQQAVNIESHC